LRILGTPPNPTTAPLGTSLARPRSPRPRPDAKRRNESVTNYPQLAGRATSRGQTRVKRQQHFAHSLLRRLLPVLRERPRPQPRPVAKRRNENVTHCPQLLNRGTARGHRSRGQTRVKRLRHFVHKKKAPGRLLFGRTASLAWWWATRAL